MCKLTTQKQFEVGTLILAPKNLNELLEIYTQFLEMATFGDWLNIIEHVGLDGHDVRTLTFHAVKLGMNIPDFSFAKNEYYVTLKILYMNKRILKNSIDPKSIPNPKNQAGNYSNFFYGLANQLSLLSGVIKTFIEVNQRYKATNKAEQVNLHKNFADFISPIPDSVVDKISNKLIEYGRTDEGNILQKFFLNPVSLPRTTSSSTPAENILDDPFAALEGLSDSLNELNPQDSNDINLPDANQLDVGLRGLYECAFEQWDKFLRGFINFAEYILQVSARKKIEGVTMKHFYFTQLDDFIRKFLAESCKKSDPISLDARKRFVEIFGSFINGQLDFGSSAV